MADIAAHHRRVADDVERRVIDVLRSGWYIRGPVVAECEAALAALFQTDHGVGVGSGTEALVLALQALGLPRGARVLVPALSFFATAEAVLIAGMVPVFGDVLPDRPLLDPERAPTDVDAAILVHLFGAKSPDAPGDHPVISDAAQAVGWDHGRPAGELVAISLYPTKTLGAAGDAGAVLTDDPALADRVRKLGVHGTCGPHQHQRVAGHPGTTSRLDAIQAAVVLAHLEDLPRRIARRNQIADAYDEALAHHAPLPRHPADALHHYLLRPADREAVQAKLAAAGVASAVYYPFPMDVQQAITGRAPRLEDSACPNAVAFCRHALAIPVHDELTDAQVEVVVETLR